MAAERRMEKKRRPFGEEKVRKQKKGQKGMKRLRNGNHYQSEKSPAKKKKGETSYRNCPPPKGDRPPSDRRGKGQAKSNLFLPFLKKKNVRTVRPFRRLIRDVEKERRPRSEQAERETR